MKGILCPYVELEQPRLVERRVEQHQHRLVQDIGPVLARVALMLQQEVVVVVRVEQHVLGPHLSRLQARALEHHDHLGLLGHAPISLVRRRGRFLGLRSRSGRRRRRRPLGRFAVAAAVRVVGLALLH